MRVEQVSFRSKRAWTQVGHYKQNGMTMLVALVVLLVMTITGLALVRTSTMGAGVAGSLAGGGVGTAHAGGARGRRAGSRRARGDGLRVTGRRGGGPGT